MAISRKNLFYLISIASVCLISAILVIVLLIGRRQNSSSLIQDSPTIASLSTDKKVATKELAKARKALKKFLPTGQFIVIDTQANILSLRTEAKVLFKADCSTGSGGELEDSVSGRRWIFSTPHGVFKIKSKLAQPWWRKPDWAYIEDSLPPPTKESERYDPEMMGDYAMGFGDGYFIHGTIYERLIGVSVTHGCVRLGTDDLKKLFGRVSIGTPVYIF
jgi:L,D-transpeptidase ErfK/SrfK